MRQGGIILHITSLPGPGGIGTLGQEAYDFADWLHKAGMSIWQVLPCGPTGYGESPYQSASMYAGNPMMISAQKLAADGLLTLQPEDSMEDDNPEKVDFVAVMPRKWAMLRRAFKESWVKVADEVAAFEKENHWAHDYALFTVIKNGFDQIQWTKWPDKALRFREPEALAKVEAEKAEEIKFQLFVQYLFFRQWKALKAYVNNLGIKIFGDMPIYVAEDSADAWTHPETFEMDKDRMPLAVGGVPPDYFSKTGQLWGNPLYNWKMLGYDDYAWWVDRMRGMRTMYDIVRVDHFIGFANYWRIPAGEKTAMNGKWVIGPGKKLFDRLQAELPDLRIVAEDLGVVSQRVIDLIAYVGYPGMRTLSFAFDGKLSNEHLPMNLTENLVYYTGTHDNDTFRSMLCQLKPAELKQAKKLLGFNTIRQAVDAAVRTCYESVCNTAIVPMQDVLALGAEARMNTPGTVGNNWHWRLKPGAASDQQAERLHAIMEETGRLPEQN